MNAFVGGYSDVVVRRHNLAMRAAFMCARWQREKDMTPLKELLVDPDNLAQERTAMSPDEQIGALDAWVIATGGELGGGKKRRRRKKV